MSCWRLLPVPVTVVTLMGPDVAPDGTAAVICPSLSTVNEVADVPLTSPCLAPLKPVPLIVMLAPRAGGGAKPARSAQGQPRSCCARSGTGAAVSESLPWSPLWERPL